MFPERVSHEGRVVAETLEGGLPEVEIVYVNREPLLTVGGGRLVNEGLESCSWTVIENCCASLGDTPFEAVIVIGITP